MDLFKDSMDNLNYALDQPHDWDNYNQLREALQNCGLEGQ
jgi:hypothetical protein